MKVRAGVVVFPGSNCDRDAAQALEALGADVEMLWHSETDLRDVGIVVLPGGFSYGDYLRAGAIARFSPVMDAVREHAARGRLVIGICNGFQVLCEAGMLPGALRKNDSLKFRCTWTEVRVDNDSTPFSALARRGDVLRMPIAHFDGNWYCDPAALKELKEHDGIVLRYTDNPNGSLEDVAGISNEDRTVFGLMPHPERACDPLLGSEDGRVIFRSMLQSITAPA